MDGSRSSDPEETDMQFAKRFVVAAAAFAALVASPVAAELAKWDQAQVTAIAQDLAKAGEGWEQATRRLPGETLGSGSAQEDFDMVQQGRVIREQSGTLAKHVASGKGQADTLDLYKSLKEVVDDTEEAAQRAELDEPTMDAWAKVADAMRRIAPYYDAKADAGK
jgi:hypothetical protein